MTNTADGHIIIDLQLQQDDFEKRLSELEKKTDNFGSKVKNSLKIAVAAGAAAFGTLVKQAVDSYAEYEQIVGGIETLFKKSRDKVIEYANAAYRTAGMSANDYMRTVTSFSASLLQALGGDTAKAAEAADSAIIDMADNSNKMGTVLESILNAYQGFAKQNYTMLDNLKLGYGGTKTEMERLLKDAQKISGIKYDINNLNDVFSAIHVIQQELGITGTTAKEASSTIEGSANAMKAAWSNFLVGMADENQNADQLVKNLVDTIISYVGNIGPRIIQTIPALAAGLAQLLNALATIILEKMPEFINSGMDSLLAFSEGFKSGIPDFITQLLNLIEQFVQNISASAPSIIQKGFEMLSNLVQGIIDGIPVMIQKLPLIITTFANIINDNFPTILAKGAELLWELIKGILSVIPALIANIPAIIEAIWSTILAFNWLNLGKNIMNSFGKGIKSMGGYIKTKGKEIFNSVTNVFSSLPSKLSQIGKNLIQELWNGINNAKTWILNKISGFTSSIVSGIKNFFGIHSPSKLMADEIGKFLPKGIAVGFEMAMPESIKDMDRGINNMTDSLQRQIDMNMSDFGVRSLLEENANLARNNSLANSFPKTLKVDGTQNVYLVTDDGTELAHWLVPYIDRELKIE